MSIVNWLRRETFGRIERSDGIASRSVAKPDNPPCGRHAFAEINGCSFETLNNPLVCEHALVDACIKGGASVLFVRTEQFEPQGLSVVAILAESHATIHTYPEHGVAFIDVFTCGKTIDPQEIANRIWITLDCDWFDAHMVKRGQW